MLSEWQTKLDPPERRITKEDPFADSPEAHKQTSIPGRDLAIEDEEDTRNYPEIPSSDFDSRQEISAPSSTIGQIREKATPSNKEIEKKSGFSPPLASTIGSPIGSSAKNSYANKEATQVGHATSSLEKSTPRSSRVKIQTKHQNFRQKRALQSVRKLSPSKQRVSTSLSPAGAGGKSQTVDRNLEERIRKLEQKFNVHVESTNSRLDSLEARIESLERKISSTGN